MLALDDIVRRKLDEGVVVASMIMLISPAGALRARVSASRDNLG